MNTFAFLAKSARHGPDTTALLQGDEVVTYREFHDRALAIGGNLLAAGPNIGCPESARSKVD